ncbi:UNVERIFIED_CONTAM: hypothetical protein FKN15_013586 [Acipenser sinensis]
MALWVRGLLASDGKTKPRRVPEPAEGAVPRGLLISNDNTAPRENTRSATKEIFADMVFLVDGSKGMGDNMFQQVKTFLNKVVQQLDVQANKYRIGVSQFSDDAQAEVLLNTFKGKNQVLNHIKKNLVYKADRVGELKTGVAIKHAIDVNFKESSGSRRVEGIPQILVIITSGSSKYDPFQQAVNSVKKHGVKIVPIGVQNTNMKEWEDMGIKYFNLSADNLTPLSRNIHNLIKTEKENQFKRAGPPPAVCQNASAADIVFLVQHSSNIGMPNFHQIQAFLYKIVDSLNVSNNTVRVGLVIYSNESKVEFFFNTYTSKDSRDNVSQAATDLRRAGVKVFTVRIQDTNTTELTEIASNPPQKFIATVDTFLQLSTLEDIIQTSICDEIFTQAFKISDLTHLLKEGMVEMFSIGPDNVRIGAVQYATSPILELNITHHSSKIAIQQAIQNIRQVGGGTRTGEALHFMLQCFQSAVTTRPTTVPQYLVTLTDGESEDEVRQVAETLWKEGVLTYAIGVKDANKTQLQELSGSDDRFFYVDNFDSLKDIKNKVVREICSQEACKKVKADIIFQIDSSGSIVEEDFKRMKQFVENIVKKLDIGVDKVQVGAIQFSYTQKEEFKLNKFSLKMDLQEAIRNMSKLYGGTLTGQALSFTSKYFERAKGGRSDVDQFLIVITDREAQDEVAAPAEALRNKGITVFSIGVFGSNNTQLEEIKCQRIEVVDIMFVVDSSDSIKEDDFNSMKEFIIALVNHSEIGKDKVQIGAIQYSHEPVKAFDLNEHFNKLKLRQAINAMELIKSTTATAKALNFSKEHLGELYSGRKEKGVPQILITITVGVSDDTDRLNETANYIRNAGITTYAVGIKNANPTELLEIGGTKERYFYVDDFEKLKGLQNNFLQIICANTTFRNSRKTAQVIEIITAFSAYNLYFSLQIVKLREQTVFLIDGSDSILPKDFQTMKEFLKAMVINFDIRPNRVQIGVAQFSHLYAKQFYLRPFNDTSTFQNQIENIGQITGFTYIANALRNVKDFFTTSAGSRKSEGVEQILLVITDGVAQDKDEVYQAAEDLRQDSITIYALGIGDIDVYQLIQIAGTPDRKFMVKNFNELETIKTRFVRNICEAPPDPKCAIDIAVGFDITSQKPGKQIFSDQHKLQVFLPEILKEMTSLQTISCVSGSQIQISFGFEITNSEPVYETQFKTLSPDIVTELSSQWVVKPSYLNRAFLELLWKKFEKSENKTKVLLIFTDGLDDTVDELKDVSERLRMEGSNALITVALEGTSTIDNIQHIEFGRGFSYKPQLTVGNRDLSRSLNKLIDHVAEKSCCGICCKCLGDEGLIGNKGPKGQKGSNGSFGRVGHPGEEGTPGIRGPPGLNGTQGFPGCEGLRGLKGSPGPKGSLGERGDPGLRGDPGESGNPGDKGQVGTLGPRGVQGSDGDPGNPGARGPKGIRGRRGESGPKGDPGSPGDLGYPGRKECELISYIHQNCRARECPVYRTELVFALDMSAEVATQSFTRMKEMVLSILEDLSFSESNCPTGTHVSLVSYSYATKYVIRFNDYHKKKQLLKSVKEIPRERTTGRQNIGAAMKFVARNSFKRIRKGALVRKMAIIFADGPSQDAVSISTATMEFSALDITPVVIAFQDLPNIKRAFAAYYTFFLLLLDTCNPNPTCLKIKNRPSPVQMDMDVAFLLDSSRTMSSDNFERSKEFLHSVLDQFVITNQPRTSDPGAGVALVQHTSSGYTQREEQNPVNLEFEFVAYSSKKQMKRHIKESLHQLQSDSGVGHALEWTINNLFSKVSKAKSTKVIFAVIGGDTSFWDKKKLAEIALNAKCQGFTIFTLTIGGPINDTEVEELASFPFSHHSCQLGKVLDLDMDYALKFTHAFFSLVANKINNYPPKILQRKCERLILQQKQQGDEVPMSAPERLMSGVKKLFIFQVLDGKITVRNDVVVTHLTSSEEEEDGEEELQKAAEAAAATTAAAEVTAAAATTAEQEVVVPGANSVWTPGLGD